MSLKNFCCLAYFRLLIFIVMSMAGYHSAFSDNAVTYTVSDSVFTDEKPKIIYVARNNTAKEMVERIRSGDWNAGLWGANEPSDGRENWSEINVRVKTANEPIKIYKAEWVRPDTLNGGVMIIEEPLKPFSLEVVPKDTLANSIIWNIHIEYPFVPMLYEDEELLIYTDKGMIRQYMWYEDIMRHSLSDLKSNYDNHVEASAERSRKIWLAIWIGIGVLIVLTILIFISVRHRLNKKREEAMELSLLMTERTVKNLELEDKVNTLYGKRMDTLNMLCNEYFDKNYSEKTLEAFFNEVEKHILALRDPKSVAELEDIVNTFLDNIMTRIKEQIPELSQKDLTFLTYLYAGFSLRAVCIFTDIKIKNFYNRRSRLKERILASDAPDKEFFVAKMDI